MLCALSSYAQKLALTLVFIAFMSASQARADDEAKRLLGGLAAGIIGMALEEHSKQDEEHEDIEWTEQKSRSTLEYQDEVAETQLKLKKLGYYNGKIDGLKGRETIFYAKQGDTNAVNFHNGRLLAYREYRDRFNHKAQF